VIETLEDRVVPATIPVTSLLDSGAGTLRAAIEQADRAPNHDTITFARSLAGTITLTSALPDLSTDIVISGPGPSVLTVARSGAPGTPAFAVFAVSRGATVAISGLTITRGQFVNGGGIINSGTLTVTNCTVSGNSATNSGGGIINSGTGMIPPPLLTVTNCTVSGNSATNSGGGIANNLGTLTVTNSTLSGNSVFVLGSGGGIFNYFGTLTVTNSTLSGNSADIAGYGGGILNAVGTLTVTNSTLSGNSAYAGGGIVNNYFGTLTITNSTLSSNTAETFGGAILNGGTLTVTNSTLSGNSASDIGGGIADSGTVGVADSGTVSISFVTVADNSATSGGGIATTDGPQDAVVSIDSIYQNAQGGNVSVAAGSIFGSLGYNIFSDTPGFSLAPTDRVNTNPLLGPLTDNGGPTFTQALLPGSPAIDAGAPVSGITTDQRDIPRPQGSAPDIGAFESRGFTLAVVQGDNQLAPAGSAFPEPLVVRVTSPFGEPVKGGQVTFAAPPTGASAALSSNPATIGADSQATVTATANGIGGTYTVTVRAAGAKDVALTLTNLGPSITPPTVVNLQRFGFHLQPTSIVLTFSEPMDPIRAEALGNYTLVAPGHGHSRVIPLKAARYNGAAQTVTLFPSQLLNLHRVYQITVNGMAPLGLTNTAGVLLDGQGNGQPGTNFVAMLRGFGLDKPGVPFNKLIRDQLGGKPISTRRGDGNKDVASVWERERS